MSEIAEHDEQALEALDAQYRRRVSRVLAGFAVAALLAIAWTGVVGSSSSEIGDGRTFPGFELTALDGGQIDDGAIEGHVTVVNFWASWCPPCRSEAPVLRAVADDTEAGGVRFLGVLHRDRVEPATEFAEQYGLRFPTAVDDGSLATAMGVRSIPATFVLDGDGRVVAQHLGPIREARLRVLIEDAQAITEAQAAAPAAAESDE